MPRSAKILIIILMVAACWASLQIYVFYITDFRNRDGDILHQRDLPSDSLEEIVPNPSHVDLHRRHQKIDQDISNGPTFNVKPTDEAIKLQRQKHLKKTVKDRKRESGGGLYGKLMRRRKQMKLRRNHTAGSPQKSEKRKKVKSMTSKKKQVSTSVTEFHKSKDSNATGLSLRKGDSVFSVKERNKSGRPSISTADKNKVRPKPLALNKEPSKVMSSKLKVEKVSKQGVSVKNIVDKSLTDAPGIVEEVSKPKNKDNHSKRNKSSAFNKQKVKSKSQLKSTKSMDSGKSRVHSKVKQTTKRADKLAKGNINRPKNTTLVESKHKYNGSVKKKVNLIKALMKN